MKKKTILVCDDDAGIVDVMRIVLSEAGHAVVTADDTDEACSKVRTVRPDLILLDLWMPGMGGERLIAHLRSKPASKDIPVIVVSASKNTQVVAERAGATAYLHKPFDISELEQLVNKFL